MLRKILFVLTATVLTGCFNLRPSLMLKTPKDYVFDTLPKTPDFAYKISPNDLIEMRMYANNGFKLIEISDVNGQVNSLLRVGHEYVVEYDGTVKLPELGRITLAGMTLREAELFLEDKYVKLINDPYILVKVVNRRVIVFPGSEGKATVITLTNENTTLIEGLALAGGIYNDGKAKRIKLIRGDPKSPKVYLIDLSSIDGMKSGDVVLQANDIVYVESRPRVGTRFISEIAPYISFITSMILFYELIRKFP